MTNERVLDADSGTGERVRRPSGVRSGFTLIEVLLVVIVSGVLMGIAVTNFRGLSDDLENATAETAGFLRQVRTRAMTTTSAYRVVYESPIHLRAEHARRCEDTSGWESDERLQLHLRERTAMEVKWDPGDVVVCFSSRGVATASPSFVIRNHRHHAAGVEVFLGGAVRVTRTVGEP